MEHTEGDGYCRAGILCTHADKWSPDKDERPCVKCKINKGCSCNGMRCICNYLLTHMTAEKAVTYLKYGAEMHSTLKGLDDIKSYEGVRQLLSKLAASTEESV